MKRFIQYISVFVLTVASVASLPVSSLSAEDNSNTTSQCDQQFYSSNDVLFYNPCSTSCNVSPNGTTGTVSSLKGKNNGEKIVNFWIDAGFSSQQAAGIAASIKHESGFSAFRQEGSQTWPSGGWGIAQFTAGQRDSATSFVRDAVGEDMFNQYYKPQFGGAVLESNGFIPAGVLPNVNDSFLLGELNYLLTYSKGFKPYSVRTNLLKQDFGQEVPTTSTLYDYLKTIVLAGDVAVAWTYLYEMPANIKTTATARQASGAEVYSLYANGVSTGCGGNLATGGMNLSQAVKFMEDYKSNPDNVKYIGGADQSCTGGPLSNCVSFSVYFINKYTNIQGFTSGRTGNGSIVVANIIARNPSIENGHSPRPYAIFSTPSGTMTCGAVKCGHTGVILGVDTVGGKVIVGEAGCGAGSDWDTAREYPLSQFDSDAYTYAYTDGLLKGEVN